MNDLSFAINNFVQRAQEKATLLVKKIVVDLSDAVILRTPVDSGRLRANWQLGLDSEPQGALSEEDKSGKIASSRNAAKAFSMRLGQTVFLTNNLPYARVVEYGLYPNPVKLGTYVPEGKKRDVPGGKFSGPGFVKLSRGGYSLQAPKGMARISVREVAARLKK